MTRINMDVDPVLIDDWRLIAEINEMTHVFQSYEEHKESNIPFDIPKEFSIGKTRVSFWLDKHLFLHKRLNSLIEEYRNREDHFSNDVLIYEFEDAVTWLLNYVKKEHYNDYKPTEKDRKLLVNQIIIKIEESDKLPYYYGKQERKDVAINRLKSIFVVDNAQMNLF